MNHLELLKKYMAAVQKDCDKTFDQCCGNERFTDEELDLIKQIENEVWND